MLDITALSFIISYAALLMSSTHPSGESGLSAFFSLASFTNITYVICCTSFISALCQLKRRETITASIFMVVLFVTLLYLTPGNLALTREVVGLCLALGGFIYYFMRHIKAHHWSTRLRIAQALIFQPQHPSLNFRIIALTAALSVLSFAINNGVLSWDFGPLSLSWLAAAYLYYEKIKYQHSSWKTSLSLAQLGPKSSKRIYQRYFQDSRQQNAASMGYKTAIFEINHDPSNELSKNLPASLMQIRSSEIKIAIETLLKQNLLEQRKLGNELHGIIDREHSFHPCIDALILMSILHLDGTRLVEKRLARMKKILPIMDEGLFNQIQDKKILDSPRQNLWLYHLDYAWIDEQILQTHHGSLSYTITSPSPHAERKNKIYAQLNQGQNLGSFIWISEAARSKLLTEGPDLHTQIQNNPIELPEEDIMVYTLNFESVIPYLQKYFCLDDFRKVFQEFPASKDALRFLKISETALENCQTQKDLCRFCQDIAAYPWRGFSEKDHALEIILMAHDYAKSMNLINAQVLASIKKAIETIGYPGQAAHLGQLKKMQLRQLNNLLNIAMNHEHPNCHDAWIYIVHLDYNRLTQETLEKILSSICGVSQKPALSHDPVILGKALETIQNLIDSRVRPEIYSLASLAFCDLAFCLQQKYFPIDLYLVYFDVFHRFRKSIQDQSLVAETTTALKPFLAYCQKLSQSNHLSRHQQYALQTRIEQYTNDLLLVSASQCA